MTPSGPRAAESWAAAPAPGWAGTTQTELPDLETFPSPPYDDEAAWSWQPDGATTFPEHAEYDQPDYADANYDDEGDWDYDQAPVGLPGRAVILFAGAATAGLVAVNLALTSGQLTFFFDLCFVVTCLVTTMAVRRADLFTAGVLPPLLYAAVIAVLSVAVPNAFEAGPGVNQVFLTGLANHAAGLVAGYAVALAAVAARIASSSQRRP